MSLRKVINGWGDIFGLKKGGTVKKRSGARRARARRRVRR